MYDVPLFAVIILLVAFTSVAAIAAYAIGYGSGESTGIALGRGMERDRIRKGIEEW